jgi:hypothetical protein
MVAAKNSTGYITIHIGQKYFTLESLVNDKSHAAIKLCYRPARLHIVSQYMKLIELVPRGSKWSVSLMGLVKGGKPVGIGGRACLLLLTTIFISFLLLINRNPPCCPSPSPSSPSPPPSPWNPVGAEAERTRYSQGGGSLGSSRSLPGHRSLLLLPLLLVLFSLPCFAFSFQQEA